MHTLIGRVLLFIAHVLHVGWYADETEYPEQILEFHLLRRPILTALIPSAAAEEQKVVLMWFPEFQYDLYF